MVYFSKIYTVTQSKVYVNEVFQKTFLLFNLRCEAEMRWVKEQMQCK